MEDNRLIICRDFKTAADECNQLAEKLKGEGKKGRFFLKVDGVCFHFMSVIQLSNGKMDAYRFTDVKVLSGVYESRFFDYNDALVIAKLEARAGLWKEYISKGLE